jgi:hypothetical protein
MSLPLTSKTDLRPLLTASVRKGVMGMSRSGATLVASGDAVPEGSHSSAEQGLTRVRVLWYDDGSIRVRAYVDQSHAIKEAYLQVSGDKPNDHVIVAIEPRHLEARTAPSTSSTERTPLRHECVIDPSHFTFGYYRIMAGDRIEANVCQCHIPDLSSDRRARLVIVSEDVAKAEAGIW